jgi:hypothetical protein
MPFLVNALVGLNSGINPEKFEIMTRLKFLIVLVCFSVSASAQIQGDITDSSGKAVPDAFIIATANGKLADTVKSGKLGFYEFKKLKPGIYRIEVKAAGFRPAVQENVEVKETDTGYKEGYDDVYYGQRLDFLLTPVKASKQ